MAVDDAKHTFISFSSRDQVKAKAICDSLEHAGFRCWISSRDVPPGGNYQASIVEAIQNALLMILVFSESTNLSQEVQKELSLASAFKTGVVPVRISDVRPNGALMYELATRQWIDAFEDWDDAMARLLATAQMLATAPPGLAGSLTTTVASAAIVRAAINSAAEVTAPVAEAPPLPASWHPAGPSPERSSSAAAAATFSKEQLDVARAALTFHIGPIADILVRKASAKATSLQQFHEELVSHIKSPAAQDAFRKRIQAS